MLQLLAHFGARKLLELDEITGRKTGESGGPDERIELACTKFFKDTSATSDTRLTFDYEDFVNFRALMLSSTHMNHRETRNICKKAIHAVYIVQLLEEVNFFETVLDSYRDVSGSLIGGLILELLFRLEYSLTPIIVGTVQRASGYYPTYNTINIVGEDLLSNTYHVYHKGRLYIFAKNKIKSGTVLTRKSEVSIEKFQCLPQSAKDLFHHTVNIYTEKHNYSCYERRSVRDRLAEGNLDQTPEPWSWLYTQFTAIIFLIIFYVLHYS